MNPSIIAMLVIVVVVAAVIVAWYLQKNIRFSKGNYGKSAVKSALHRYALTHNYKVLENVQMQLDGQTSSAKCSQGPGIPATFSGVIMRQNICV